MVVCYADVSLIIMLSTLIKNKYGKSMRYMSLDFQGVRLLQCSTCTYVHTYMKICTCT